jgi:hypothetical protein
MVILGATGEKLARNDVRTVGDVRIEHRAVVVIRRPGWRFGRIGCRLQPDCRHMGGRSLRDGTRSGGHKACGRNQSDSSNQDRNAAAWHRANLPRGPGDRSAWRWRTEGSLRLTYKCRYADTPAAQPPRLYQLTSRHHEVDEQGPKAMPVDRDQWLPQRWRAKCRTSDGPNGLSSDPRRRTRDSIRQGAPGTDPPRPWPKRKTPPVARMLRLGRVLSLSPSACR